MTLQPGNRVFFKNEKRPYKVMATDSRFAILTKPFNLKKTYLYTILDFKLGIRGSDNYRCKFDYQKESECLEAINELHSGKLEISRRNTVQLDINKIL
jgi:hypothetical protein